MRVHVLAQWDEEAKVWVATSDDVPGLVTEAESRDELVEILRVLIPELLAANGVGAEEGVPEVPIELLATWQERISLR